MKRLIVLTMALALTGCDTISGIKYSFDQSSFGDRARTVIGACAARMQNRDFDGIRDKVELVRSPPDGPVPFAILTDNAVATPDEERVIGLWAKTLEQCQSEARTLIDGIPVPPDATRSEVQKLTSYITDAWIQGSQLRVTLYTGQTSYADYANGRLRAAEDALKTAERYAQDSDEENENPNLEDVETALEPFAALL
jgi:hypothetical protein